MKIFIKIPAFHTIQILITYQKVCMHQEIKKIYIQIYKHTTCISIKANIMMEKKNKSRQAMYSNKTKKKQKAVFQTWR